MPPTRRYPLLLCAILIACGAATSLPARAQVRGADTPNAAPQPLPTGIPTPLPAGAAVSLPAPERVTLPNGLAVYVVERHSLPIVAVSVEVRAGAAQDPRDRPGVASLLAGLLKRGTTRRGAPQIAEAIDFIGGSLAVGAGPESSVASLTVLKRDLDTGMDLLSDVLLHPSFPAKELERLAEETRAGLATGLDDPNGVLHLAFAREVFAGHPYGRSTTLGSLKGIGLAELRRYYEAYYRPNNAYVVVVGDITPQEARTRLLKAFGTWKPRALSAAERVAAPQKTPARRVVLVDMPVNQSFISLGHVGVRRNNPDYFPLTVLNFILGGDFSSRLNQTIRDKQGLAYGAGSRFGMLLNGGSFSASLNTKSESTGKALASLVGEIGRMQSQPVSASELGFAKDYLTGSFPLRFETNADLAREVANNVFYGLPANYLATYRDRVRAVSAADISRVAREYLQPDRYVLVVVGKGSVVAPQLAPFGPVTRLDKASLIR